MPSNAPSASSSEPTNAPRTRRRSTVGKQRTAAYLLITPFFLVFFTMLVLPLAYSGYLSFFTSQLIGGQTFAGFDNYIRAFSDPRFLSGVGRMVFFLLVQVPIMISLALFLALALDSGRARGAKFARLAIFIPYAVPGVVATLMWGYLYGNDFGPIAQTMRFFGLDAPNLLAPDRVLGSMMNIVSWEFVGYNMIIMYAALRSIPEELYEAAEIDGASQIRIARSIKIPAIKPAILLTVIFSIIGTFQLFNEPQLLSRIAPNAIDNAFTPNLYAYNLAFVSREVNYAATIAFTLGFVIMIVSLIVQGLQQRREKKA
jgi:multiple sugar transport system permease protein